MVILVLGMHRSGTSMTAAMIHELGVSMGKTFIDRNRYNPLGYYEDADFHALNRRILAEAGGSWMEPPSHSEIVKLKRVFEQDVTQLLACRSGNWGWKDPRTSLTLPIYIPFLDNILVVVCHREQSDVVNSLCKRDNMSALKAKRLYTCYYDRINRYLQSVSRQSVLRTRFSHTKDNPREFVEKFVEAAKINPSVERVRNAINHVNSEASLSTARLQILAKKIIKKIDVFS